MAKCKLVKAKDRTFETLAGPPGAVRVGRDVQADISETIGCGVVEMEGISMPWTVKYDEYFYCLDGVMTLRVGDEAYVMEPGDGLWIPKDTELVYEAEGLARLVVAIYPVNWREIEGIE